MWLYSEFINYKISFHSKNNGAAASKRGHETKRHVLIGCLTWRVFPPNIWSLKAVKANCRAKGKLFICFLMSAFRWFFIFLNFLTYFSLRNTTLASRDYSKRLKILQILQTSNVWRQNMSCLHPVRTCFFPHVYTLKCNWRYLRL